jgi:phage gpG-like protein
VIDIGVSVSGSLKMPNSQEMAGAIRRGMTKIAFTIANQATQNADGRPGPNVQTGRLRSSIVGRVSGDGMSAVIGSNVEYAPRIEMGYRGPESVKAHTRTIRQAFGRPIAPRDVQVSAFTRTANAPSYPFLRPAVEYAQRIHAIEDILQAEIDKAVNS